MLDTVLPARWAQALALAGLAWVTWNVWVYVTSPLRKYPGPFLAGMSHPSILWNEAFLGACVRESQRVTGCWAGFCARLCDASFESCLVSVPLWLSRHWPSLYPGQPIVKY